MPGDVPSELAHPAEWSMSSAAVPGLAALDAALRDVARPVLMERSVKRIGAECRTGRRLVSFPREALGAGPSRHLRRIATELAAPEDGFALLDRMQSRAIAVHLGLEPEAEALTQKLYLEFRLGQGPEPDIRFVALKWRGAAWTHSLYRDRTALAPEAKADLIDSVAAPSAAAVLKTLLLTPDSALLEIEEPGTPRRSLDLSIAQARQRLADHPEPLQDLFGAAFHPYLAAHAQDVFGHLAAGTARDGQSFETLYHGVRRVRGALL